jgi:Tfp pilus assembly protein PilF
MEASRRALDSDPNDWTGHYFLAVAQDGIGHHADAIHEYQRAVDLSQHNTDAVAGLAHGYATTGEKAQAAKILRELQQQSKETYVSPYMIATIYASLGDGTKAFEFLEAAFRARSPDIAYFLKADLRLDLLRTDLRYSDLVRRVGFPQ